MDFKRLSLSPVETLGLLVSYFIFLALVLYNVHLGQWSWVLLAASAIVWFAYELRNVKDGYGIVKFASDISAWLSRKKRFQFPVRVKLALAVGTFLLLFDFIFENLGWIEGLWQTFSPVHVGVVPIEVMIIAFFGGAAWALYLPQKFNKWHSLADCILFGFFGALGERMLIHQGLFVYNLWWTSVFAFAAYFATWVILHFVRYKVFAK